MCGFRSNRIKRLGTMNRRVAAWLVGVLALAAGTVWAQGPNRSGPAFNPDSSVPAETLLRNAASHVRDRQWSEAIKIYQRVIEQFGDKVAKLPKGEPGTDPSGDFVLYVDDRGFCHRCLAHLPPEAREIYRNRVDSVAERWFREGAGRRDQALLRRVVDEAFCSAWGDDALELLGDLAFQDGRFAEALWMYRRLVPDRTDSSFVLVHPDPSVDLARVAAKKLLCRAADGENPPGQADLDAFARRFPGASGSLAGRPGAYDQIVAQALASDHLAQPSQPDNRWPTFAGSQRRTKIVSGPVDVGSKQWRVKLEQVPSTRAAVLSGRGMGGMGMGMGSTPVAAERLLAFHPIVLGDQVIVCNGVEVVAYNLNDRPADPEETGAQLIKHAWKYPAENGGPGPQATRNSSGIPRFTLTAIGHKIYARMGTTSAPWHPGMGGMIGGRGFSSIVALDWNKEGAKIWEQEAAKLELPNRRADRRTYASVSFEGTPVGDARNVYVAVTDRREQTATYVACFDADTGMSRWIRYLGTASTGGNNLIGFGMGMQVASDEPGDYNHRLLALDGPALYYQTNLGAVVALEAETGATLWVATYPRQETTAQGAGSERDLNPAVVHEGRVFVAPSDANAIFAFEADSGRLLWKTEPISEDVKLSHLLGVAKGRLVATGDRVLLFDVENGRLLQTWPDSGKSLEGYGRGLLAGDLIYWPTKNEIQVLHQRTGLRVEPPIKLQETYHQKSGNLVAGDGYLIVAQVDGLAVFCQNSRLIERYRDEIAQFPDRAANYFRLARAAEATGRDQLALDSYRNAGEKARSNETIDGVPLAGAARDHQFRLLVRLAGDTRRARKWDESIALLESAAVVAGTDPERLQALLLLADVLLDAARPKSAVEICERLLADERLRPLAVATPDGHRTIRADILLADRVTSIVRDHGREIYHSYDREASRLFERGKKEKDPRALDEVVRLYPAAQIVPDALLELGLLYESTQRLSEAAHAYKRLLLLATDDERRARAIWRLARVYKARRLYVSARDSYLDLQARYPKIQLKDGDRQGTVAELVSAELARPWYAQSVGDRPAPPTPLPLVRRWHWQAPAKQTIRAISAEGVAPSLDAGRIFLTDRGVLRFLDPATGSTRWSSDLGAPAVWAGYLADKLIAATPRQIVALELGQGTVQWKYSLGTAGKDHDRPDPFARANANPAAAAEAERGTTLKGAPPGETLSGFRLVKGRVFCLRGQRELIALDGDTGDVDWSFSAPPGEINPNLWIGPDRTVLQLDKPNQLLVLKTEDGEPVAQTSLADNESLERPPIPMDEDSVVLVTDRRTVKKFDLNHGQTTWIYRESTEPVLLVNGSPRIMGDGERLFVLHDGRFLIRLDPASGSRRWSSVLGTEDLSDRPGAMAYDDKRFYCVNHQTLRAISLEDGKPIWSCHLTGPQDVPWSIALTQGHVMAYPSGSSSTDGGEVENLPVIVRQRETGALVQRFMFATAIADVTFKVDPRGVVVATSKGLWSLGPKF
jgi:cellulose synthase operon protein C